MFPAVTSVLVRAIGGMGVTGSDASGLPVGVSDDLANAAIKVRAVVTPGSAADPILW